MASTKIISGEFKNRNIVFDADQGVRPTLARIKKTMFDWLMGRVSGAVCLDLFAGSGSLGLEALSLQAGKVIFVDINKENIKNIQTSLDIFGVDVGRYSCLLKGFPQVLSCVYGVSFDIIFIDPPYRKFILYEVLLELVDMGCITDNTLIVYEGSGVDLVKVKQLFNIIRSKSTKTLEYGLLQLRQE